MQQKKTYKYKVRRAFTYKGITKDIRAKNETEYEAKKEKFKKKIDQMALSGQNLTVEEWAEKCIREYKPNQKEITKRKYASRVRHCIIEEIGNIPMTLVTPDMCQAVLNRQSQNSQAQINEVYNALRFIFKRALINNHISVDPTVYLDKPKGTFTPRRALTLPERNSVLEVAAQSKRYYFALLMLLCGCRSSEAISCRGEDIIEVRIPVLKDKLNDNDFELYNTYHALHIKGTKTKLSDRTVPIPDELYALIKDTPSDAYIAQDINGNQMTETSRRNAWRALRKEILAQKGEGGKLGEDLCPYCLRHEYCTELARRGVDIRTAQYLMGHSSISLTANIYSNITSADLGHLASHLGFTTELKK